MSARVMVLLVDDHAVVREGYRRLLEIGGGISVMGEASSAAEAYQMFCSLEPERRGHGHRVAWCEWHRGPATDPCS